MRRSRRPASTWERTIGSLFRRFHYRQTSNVGFGSSGPRIQKIRTAIDLAAAEFRTSGNLPPRPEDDQDHAADDSIWVLECSMWTGLWEVYSGDEEQLPSSALAEAKSDLAALSLPPGMNKTGFEKALRTAFRHTRIFQEVDKLSQEGLTDLAAHPLPVELCGIASGTVSRR